MTYTATGDVSTVPRLSPPELLVAEVVTLMPVIGYYAVLEPEGNPLTVELVLNPGSGLVLIYLTTPNYEAASIRYTLDESDVTSESILYTEPFTIEGEIGEIVTLKYKAFSEPLTGFDDSLENTEVITIP